MAPMLRAPILSLDDLTFIDAENLRDSCSEIPEVSGIYLWFVRGGNRILELTHHQETDARVPLSYEGRAHLYTGAAWDLRFRITQHLRCDSPSNSSPRKSLLAVERIFSAVSQAIPSQFNVEAQGGLTEWIYENVVFGIRKHSSPFEFEPLVLNELRSPFNIAHRRRHRYSKYLMAWRAIAFPSDWMEGIPFGNFERGMKPQSRAATRKRLSAAVQVK